MTQSIAIKELSVGLQLQDKILRPLEGINFTLTRGETVALVGESGCGKSLTSLALMRLLPLNARYGKASQVCLGEDDLLMLPESLMRAIRGRRMAMIFQEPMTALNPVRRIDHQLAEIIVRQGTWNSKTLKKRLLSLLEEVEISEPALRLTQYPHQLSGGQRQRIVIAMALANHPEILIADEPTTALDVTVQAQILELIKKLQKQYEMSLLLITHDLSIVREMADQVLVMYAGEIVEHRLKNDFFTEVKHPYSQQLLASLPSFEKRGARLHSLSGSVPSIENWPFGCRFHPRCPYAFETCTLQKPSLFALDDLSLVRCHLYPKQSSLLSLSVIPEKNESRKTTENCLLKVDNLVVHFSSSPSLFKPRRVIKAVDGVSFELLERQTLAIVGESGCGKTTVSRALMRLLTVQSGTILYHNKPLHAMKRRALKIYRREVQLIFQDPFSSMNPRLTVGEIIAEGMYAQGLSRSSIQNQQKKLLDHVNLPENSLNRYPYQFSGGQRQRICIARALAMNPKILICDEPTSALDISVQAQILNLFKDLQKELGISYVFVTHNMAVVAYMADRILVMRHGKGVEWGTCEQVLHSPKDEYTKRLLEHVS